MPVTQSKCVTEGGLIRAGRAASEGIQPAQLLPICANKSPVPLPSPGPTEAKGGTVVPSFLNRLLGKLLTCFSLTLPFYF